MLPVCFNLKIITCRIKVWSPGIAGVNCLENDVPLSRDIQNCTWCSKYTARQTCGKHHTETLPRAGNYFLLQQIWMCTWSVQNRGLVKKYTGSHDILLNIKLPSLGSVMWSRKNVGLLHKTDWGSGKLGGRPQLTGMGLDKPGEPQTRYFS